MQASHTRQAGPHNRQWGLAVVILTSLLLRLVAWGLVVHAQVPPFGDERGYLTRGVGCENLLRSYLGSAPSTEEWRRKGWNRVYGEGIWPPLHPFLLSIGFLIFGRGLGVARLIVVLQSVVTTGVIYALTARLANRRAALLAAAIHAVYPSFIAYSHYLWSETTYILTWSTCLYCVVRAADARLSGQQLSWSALGGICLGLTGLTRAAVLPLLAMLPVWLALKVRRRDHHVASAVLFLVTLVVLSPWIATLSVREQRFLTLSSAGGLNLYEGNNVAGNSVAQSSTRRPVLVATVRAYAAEHRMSEDEAARTLAFSTIRADVPSFVHRCWDRMVSLWMPDAFVVRHVLDAIYPPLPAPAALAIWAVVILTFLAFLTVSLLGLTSPGKFLRQRGLLISSVLVGAAPYIVTTATTRRALPLLATLLPAAGVGLASLRERAWRPVAGCLVAILALTYLSYRKNPREMLAMPWPVSSYYAAPLRMIESFTPTRSPLRDRLFFRITSPTEHSSLRLELVNTDYRFVDFAGPSITWQPTAHNRGFAVDVWTRILYPDDLTLRATVLPSDASTLLRPITRSAWRRWSPVGTGLWEFAWAGPGTPSEADVDALLAE